VGQGSRDARTPQQSWAVALLRFTVEDMTAWDPHLKAVAKMFRKKKKHLKSYWQHRLSAQAH